MLGCECLYKDLAGTFASSGSSGHLGEQLEGALGRAEIGDIQGSICRDYSNQSDVREIQTFRDNLSTDQDVGIAAPERAQGFGVRALARHSIAVHAQGSSRGKELRDRAFHLLGP